MAPSGTTILVGLAASPGIAIGRCWTVERRKVRTPKRRLPPEEVENEAARLKTALDVSDLQLAEVRENLHTDLVNREMARQQRAYLRELRQRSSVVIRLPINPRCATLAEQQ